MPKRVAFLRLDARRIGIRDPDPELVAALSRTAHVLEMPQMEGLEAAVNHPSPHGGRDPTRRRRRSLLRPRRPGAGKGDALRTRPRAREPVAPGATRAGRPPSAGRSRARRGSQGDRKSTRLNSSHTVSSYAV